MIILCKIFSPLADLHIIQINIKLYAEGANSSRFKLPPRSRVDDLSTSPSAVTLGADDGRKCFSHTVQNSLYVTSSHFHF